MLWNLLVPAALILAAGVGVITWALRLGGARDGRPIDMPLLATPLESAWHEQPVQTFVLQVQVARYWQPPFRNH